jgi:hypothetical protein
MKRWQMIAVFFVCFIIKSSADWLSAVDKINLA